MTVVRDDSERVRQLHLAQLLHGPAQRALAYCYSYCYTKQSDVLGYITRQDLRLQFKQEELQLLARVRTPKQFTIPTLYRIFKFCCDDKLADRYSKEWDENTTIKEPVTLEEHISCIHRQHEQFCAAGGNVDVDNLSQVILGVIKCVAERLGISKWKQQQDSLKKTIADILEEIHPALDVTERVSNAAKIEAEMMCSSLASYMTRSAEEQRKSQKDEFEYSLQDMKLNLTQVKGDIPEQGEDAHSVAPEELLEVLHKQSSEKIDGKQICCISGEHGTGKSTLAAKFPVCWSEQSDAIKEISLFDYVLPISGNEIELTSIDKWVGRSKTAKNDLSSFIDSYWSVVEAFLPRCCAKYGVKNVGQLLSSKKVLFVIDDAEEISDAKVKELILFLGQIIFDSVVLIFGNLESIVKIKLNFISFSSAQHLHLHGICKDYILEVADKFKELVKTGKIKVQKSFRDTIKGNMNRFGRFLQYPQLFKEIISMWKSQAKLVKDCFSASELLWNLIYFRSNAAFQNGLHDGVTRKGNWMEWIMTVGEMSHYCLKANIKLNKASLAEIQESANLLFYPEESEYLMATFFGKKLILNSKHFESIPTSKYFPQLEYFSSYFVAEKLKEEETLLINDFLPKVGEEDFIALVAGHIERWNTADTSDREDEEIDIEVLRRIVTNLVTYDSNKLEDIQFFMKIAAEFCCSHKLVQLMVNVTEYPEEWDLKLCLTQQKPLEVMMLHVSPVRIILRTDETVTNYEQLSLLKFLSKVPISVWFESRDQFKYGSEKRMDRVLRPFFNDKTMSRIDLFSGTLSRQSMLDFSDFKCMTYIVMLAIRVMDETDLQTAVALPAHLPHILWFELKIDMSIENIVLTSLPNMEVEMFDVYLRDLNNLCIPQVTGLLYKLHKRYSGIHLDNTTLSPESIYTLLKQLKERNVALCATAKAIDKYRRWYYPLLSNLPTDKLLTDKEVKKILGFEDRKFYSDHKIHSSIFVKSIDAWNLTSYLEELKEIKYFLYKADNLSFAKTLKGEVETKHFSAIHVDTTGEIL